MTSAIEVKQGEAKTLTFTVTDGSGGVVDLTGATFLFEVEDAPGTPLFQILDAAFDKTDVLLGIVTAPLAAIDTNNPPRKYESELRITFPGVDVDKSITIAFTIIRAITP